MGLLSNAIRGASIHFEMHYPIGGLHCIRGNPFYSIRGISFYSGGYPFRLGDFISSGGLHAIFFIPGTSFHLGGTFILFRGLHCFRGTSCRSRYSILFWGLFAIGGRHFIRGPSLHWGDFIPFGRLYFIRGFPLYSGDRG